MAAHVGIRPGEDEPRKPKGSNYLMHIVRARRIERGISMHKLAKMTGFDVTTLFRYEAGTMSPTLDRFSILCEALELFVEVVDLWDPKFD